MDFLAGLLEPFHWQFMRNALLAVLVISPLFGLLSTMVVTSRMSFFSDALGHSAFTGIAIGTLCGLADPLWMAVLLAAVFALLFTYVRRKSNMASDTVIGVFSSTAVALGIFIATFGGGSFTQYNSLLIGDILSVEPAKIALLAVILLVVVLLWLCSFNQLMLSSIHPALADSRGVGVFWQEAVFSAAIAVVVTVSMTWVGLLVINSLLVLPAAAARNVARNMRQYHLFSLLGAVISGLADDLLLYRLFRRGVHHPLSGGLVCRHLSPAKKVYISKSTAEAWLPRCSCLLFMPESNPPRRRPGHPAPRPCRRRERRPYSTAR
mgnify:CR=1 FL=1